MDGNLRCARRPDAGSIDAVLRLRKSENMPVRGTAAAVVEPAVFRRRPLRAGDGLAPADVVPLACRVLDDLAVKLALPGAPGTYDDTAPESCKPPHRASDALTSARHSAMVASGMGRVLWSEKHGAGGERGGWWRLAGGAMRHNPHIRSCFTSGGTGVSGYNGFRASTSNRRYPCRRMSIARSMRRTVASAFAFPSCSVVKDAGPKVRLSVALYAEPYDAGGSSGDGGQTCVVKDDVAVKRHRRRR